MTWKDIRPLRPRGAIEGERIASIPLRKIPSQSDIDRIQKENVSPTAYAQGMRLLEAQVEALFAWEQYERGFFSVAVGEGKTLISLLIASQYHEKHPNHRIIIFMPASVYRQLWVQDIPWARRHFNILVSFVGLGQRTQKQRKTLTGGKLSKCYLFPYSLLSTLDTIDMLNNINADLVIADEAHYLKESNSAKSKRFWHWLNSRKTLPKGVVMSGTLTSRSPLDYYRLIKWTLKDYSPLPNVAHIAENWASLLDSDSTQLNYQQVRSMRPLTKWANIGGVVPTIESLRTAYQKRLHACPGFITSGEDKIGTSLRIENYEARSDGDDFNELVMLMRDVEHDWISPSGDYFACALEKHRLLAELSSGFYHRLFWPEHPNTPRARECWEVKQIYMKQLRGWYSSWYKPRKGLDTPFAVGLDMSKYGRKNVTPEIYRLWKEWKKLDTPNLPDRLSEPIRICNYKIEKALHWTLNKTGGIIWYFNNAIGDWLEEVFREHAIPTLRKKAGSEWLRNDGSEEFFVLASIKAHGIGKNLQHHSNQLIVQWPRSGVVVEQLLGRVHRKGQMADEIVVTTMHTMPFDHQALSVTLKETVYSQQTLGGQRKLLIADWSPLPQNYPEYILRNKGWKI